MSDIHAIAETVRRLRAEQTRYLVATVMQVSGSSYRPPGARMIIGEDGTVTGGISAGCLEGALIRTAWWRTRANEAVLVKYDSTSDDDELGWGSGFGCNGVVEVLLEREHAASEAALDFITGTVSREQAVILSHHYDRDRDLLEALLGSKTDYVGILGPRARALRLLADVGQHTLSTEALRRIHAPIGLDIGAETPQEIGLAVMAEIQAVLSGSSAKPLSQCRGRIHRSHSAYLEALAVGAE